MPGGFPLLGDVCNGQSVGTNIASSDGTTLTSGGANTKGSWVQLISSTAADCVLAYITAAYNSSADGSDQCSASIDIGIGGAGSEVVLVQDLLIGPEYTQQSGIELVIPLNIPVGTRVSARCQTSSTTAGANTCLIALTLFDGSFAQGEGASGVDALGFVSSTTKGAAILPSATVDTFGSYVTVIASTAKDYTGIFGLFENRAGQLATAQSYLLSVAIGAAASENDIIPTKLIRGGVSGAVARPTAIIPYLPIAIPSGTRLSARCMCSSASGMTQGLSLYGVY
jgi:hypothetical protein